MKSLGFQDHGFIAPSFLCYFFWTGPQIPANDSRLFSRCILCWLHPHVPSGYHPSNPGSKEVCWWEINEEEQGQKKCHEFIRWQDLLYSDHSSDVFVLCSTVNMEEISLLNSCLGHLTGAFVRYRYLRVPSKYSAIFALKLSWWVPDWVSHDWKTAPSSG